MGSRNFIFLILIAVFISIYDLRADDKLTLEGAVGIASESKPFTSGWPGSMGPGRQLAREYAFKAVYDLSENFCFSVTAGYLRDYYAPEFRIEFPMNTYGTQVAEGGVTYGRPTFKLIRNRMKLEVGAMLYAYDSQNPRYIFRDDIFGRDENPMPVLGIEFGARDYFVFGSYLNAFPFISGGAYEMGFVKRVNNSYEHRITGSIAGYQDFALAYRGEFGIYKNIAVTPGFSWGLRDQENVYVLILGLKYAISYDHESTPREGEID